MDCSNLYSISYHNTNTCYAIHSVIREIASIYPKDARLSAYHTKPIFADVVMVQFQGSIYLLVRPNRGIPFYTEKAGNQSVPRRKGKYLYPTYDGFTTTKPRGVFGSTVADGIKISVDILFTVVKDIQVYLGVTQPHMFQFIKLEDFINEVSSDVNRFTDLTILFVMLETGVLDGKAYQNPVRRITGMGGDPDDNTFDPDLSQLATLTSSYSTGTIMMDKRSDVSFHMPGVPVFPGGTFMDYHRMVSAEDVNPMTYYSLVHNPMSIQKIAIMPPCWFPELGSKYTRVVSFGRNGYSFRGADGGQIARINYHLMAYIMAVCTIPNVESTFGRAVKLKTPLLQRIKLGIAKYTIETIAKVHLKCDTHIGDRPMRDVWTADDLDLYPRINGGQVAPEIRCNSVITLINQTGKEVTVLADHTPEWVAFRYKCGSFYKVGLDGLSMYQLIKMGRGDVDLSELYPKMCRSELFFERKLLCDWWLYDDFITIKAIQRATFRSESYKAAIWEMCDGILEMLEEVHGWVIASRRFNVIRCQAENIMHSIRDRHLDEPEELDHDVCVELDGTRIKSESFRRYKTVPDKGLARTPITGRVGTAFVDSTTLTVNASKPVRSRRMLRGKVR